MPFLGPIGIKKRKIPPSVSRSTIHETNVGGKPTQLFAFAPEYYISTKNVEIVCVYMCMLFTPRSIAAQRFLSIYKCECVYIYTLYVMSSLSLSLEMELLLLLVYFSRVGWPARLF